MAITQEIKNLDDYYSSCSNTILLNDVEIDIHEKVEDINKKLYTVYSSNIISTEPSCECGALKTRRNLNKTCTVCGEVCKSNEDIDPVIWMKDIGYKFINPAFWSMLRNIMDSNVDCLRWLSDSSYNPPKKPPFLTNALSVIGNERNYKLLVKNMVNLIRYLKSTTKFKRDESALSKLDMLIYIWETHNDVVLCSYLPVPNKSLFVMESTTKGRFINLIVGDVVNIVNEWIKVTSDGVDDRKAMKVTSKLIHNLSTLAKSLYTDFVSKKLGIFRKHLYGSRAPFTFRCTVTSIDKPHAHNIITIPWSVALSAFGDYVLNKLINVKGYKYLEAESLILRSVDKFNQDISDVLDILISESHKGMGFPICAQRN